MTPLIDTTAYCAVFYRTYRLWEFALQSGDKDAIDRTRDRHIAHLRLCPICLAHFNYMTALAAKAVHPEPKTKPV